MSASVTVWAHAAGEPMVMLESASSGTWTIRTVLSVEEARELGAELIRAADTAAATPGKEVP